MCRKILSEDSRERLVAYEKNKDLANVAKIKKIAFIVAIYDAEKRKQNFDKLTTLIFALSMIWLKKN